MEDPQAAEENKVVEGPVEHENPVVQNEEEEAPVVKPPKKGKKKNPPRCPIKRSKKASKRKCTDMLQPTPLLNSYFVCHSVIDMLKFRKFKWSKKKGAT